MTIAVRPQATRYVPLSEKEQREAAAKLASTASGDTERLLLAPEERARRKNEAEAIVNRNITKLSPKQVWEETVKRVSFMTAEASHGLAQVLPEKVLDRYRPVPNKDRQILASPESPHAGLGLIGIIDAGRGREIAIYGGNTGGAVRIHNGVPVIDVKPSDEKTQNKPRYFGIAQQRLENGKRDPSRQPLFMDMTDINDVAKRCCDLLGVPAPTKAYEYMKDRKAVEKKPEPVATMKPATPAPAALKSLPAHQAHARSLWSKGGQPSYEMTIGEQRAARAASAQATPQPERARYAYGM
ncbi:hypothetical protein HFO61_30195 [Rhizobium leguminosarum]|uniref:hypothetical protein n=1 Tax=Rhizobium leguminosarum TaxID=384 RepID=UPI001C95D397|nr:hypothetical protein [Rhizobium leguminosarum]MBY5551018.1 hypothetical protein [Rhizobium leguminosarum]